MDHTVSRQAYYGHYYLSRLVLALFYVLVGYHGEPKVNLFHTIRIL